MFETIARRTAERRQPQLLLAAQAAGAATLLTAAIAVGLSAFAGPGSPTPENPPVATEEPSPEPTRSPRVTPEPTRTPRPSATPTPTPEPTPTPTPAPATPAPPPAQPTAPPPPPAATPTPPPPVEPDYSRPGGLYLDVLTAFTAYDQWAITLLDTIFMLPADYHPGDLVDTSAAGLNGGYTVRSFVIADLKALADAARANGTPIAVVSGFRSYDQQRATFDYWVSVGGYEQALRTSARPGHSEHQLGTSLDFTSEGGRPPWEYTDWAQLPAGSWMAANAWRYGFVMSYPAGTYDRTGYDYEPWHYRYVGRQQAAEIIASRLTTREFLWFLQP
jgi:zinc D-Ala-D-Ala carboxypeptidase